MPHCLPSTSDGQASVRHREAMRSFLYWIARMIVGVATISLAVTLFGGAPGAVLGSAVVFWIVALLIGMVLSAPYAVAPPGTSMGFSFSLPIVAWIFLFA